MKWNILPWRRCRAVLEKKPDSPYHGKCNRGRNHEGRHAIDWGFGVIWFETRVIDVNQEWEPMPAYSKRDVEVTEAMYKNLWGE